MLAVSLKKATSVSAVRMAYIVVSTYDVFATEVVLVLVRNAAALLHNCPTAFCCAFIHGTDVSLPN